MEGGGLNPVICTRHIYMKYGQVWIYGETWERLYFERFWFFLASRNSTSLSPSPKATTDLRSSEIEAAISFRPRPLCTSGCSSSTKKGGVPRI